MTQDTSVLPDLPATHPHDLEVAKGLLPLLACTGGKTCHRQQMVLTVDPAAGWSTGVIGPCKRPAPHDMWVIQARSDGRS